MLARGTAGFSGADMASNFVRGIVDDIVVWPFTTDDDDWFLVDRANAPVGMALGSDPTARIALSVDGNGAYVYLDPYEGGKIVVAEAARRARAAGLDAPANGLDGVVVRRRGRRHRHRSGSCPETGF